MSLVEKYAKAISQKRTEFVRNRQQLPTTLYVSDEDAKIFTKERVKGVYGMDLHINQCLASGEFIVEL